MKNFFGIIVFLLSVSARAESFNPTFDGKHGTIFGEEYWVFDDTKEGNPYSRHEVIWSYEEAPSAAQKCAKKGHAQLKSWLADENSIVSKYLKIIGNSGGVTNFFMWTNDYQTMNAKDKGRHHREARVWNWEDMFLKYESTVLPSGECLIPKESAVIESLLLIAERQEEKRKSELNFIQRIFDGNRSRSFERQIIEVQRARENVHTVNSN